MSLPPDDPRLTAYVLGELSPSDRAAVETELAKSPNLQPELAAIETAAKSLKNALKAEGKVDITPAQHAAILTRAQSTPASSAKRVVPLPWIGYLAIAAGIVIMATLLGFWWSSSLTSLPVLARQLNANRSGAAAVPIPKQEPENASVASLASVTKGAPSVESAPLNPTAPGVLTAPIAPAIAVLPPPAPQQIVFSPPPSLIAAASLPKSPLKIQLPIPAFIGTPTDIPLDEHIEKPSDGPRPPFLAPQGCANVALHKKVTSSDLNPTSGSLELITDGDKESIDTSFVELHRKTQWVQIDLETPCALYAVVIWHAHNIPQIHKDVIVQLADDPGFTANVRTVFNNDWDNSSGLGAGHNKEYFESYEGKLIDTQGQPARYLRLYSKGSTFSALNRYIEVEAYGLPLTP